MKGPYSGTPNSGSFLNLLNKVLKPSLTSFVFLSRLSTKVDLIFDILFSISSAMSWKAAMPKS